MTISLDLLAIGEALVDFISDDFSETLAEARSFTRYAGGQVANLAVTFARLGKRSALAACLGEDGLGSFIRRQVDQAGVITQYLQQSADAPTTFVVVARSAATPDFLIFRGADTRLRATPDLLEAASNCRHVHTSAFALARQPARDAILQMLSAARQHGSLVSIDPNYHPKISPDVPDFPDVLRQAFALVDVTKPSLDDAVRLFGPGLTPLAYAEKFLEWGARTVVMTLGSKGTLLATASGERWQLHPHPIEVVDVTGAGDSYWGGLISALLDRRSPLEAACFGQAVAEYKIGLLGQIQQQPDLEKLYQVSKTVKVTHVDQLP